VLPVTSSTIRLFLHVLGATVWVGGQIALAGVVPVVRRAAGVDTVRLVAHRFQQIAWPAFALLLVTGVWNLFEVKLSDRSSDYIATLGLKLGFVVLSGLCAAGHALFTGPSVVAAANEAQASRRRAFSGALAGLALLFALGAMFLGIMLHP
jgi:putative copper export protein